jgi:chromatin modification-related protein EAF6
MASTQALMNEVVKRRSELKSELTTIEKQIYDLESSYLEETRDFGNVFMGWNAYLSFDKSKSKKVIGNEERLFSLSSMTSPAGRRAEREKEKAAGSGSGGGSAVVQVKVKVKEEKEKEKDKETETSTSPGPKAKKKKV